MGASVLVVGRSDEVRDRVVGRLVGAGYAVTACGTREEATARLEEVAADVAVLDWERDEDERLVSDLLVRAVRVLVVSTLADVESRVRALELGADDYLVKPVDPHELELRVAAVLRRRCRAPAGAVLSFRDGWLVVDRAGREIRVAGCTVPLTRHEWDLLLALALNPGRAVSRTQLAARARHGRGGCCERTVDTHISNLRRKIGDGPGGFRLIETVPGVGYRFLPERDPSPDAGPTEARPLRGAG